MSHDKSKAISIIGFIGSVFSPWYYWSGRKNPANHCCINAALYGKGWRWTMTERGSSELKQSNTLLRIGPSEFVWDSGCLTINLNEISNPHFDRVRGSVKIIPSSISNIEVALTADGAHIWRPFAPNANIEVNIDKPGWTWTGSGYFDGNFGTRALEQDFSYWTWARLPISEGSAAFYDARLRNDTQLNVSLKFLTNGTVEPLDPPPLTRLSRSLWAVKRETRADHAYKPHQIKHMLDTPFYTRSAIKTSINGEESVGIHEALDLNRFSNPLLKPMLALRVPRRFRWS
ncbi:MAG: carotenoid 1,2-hydratase [Pseudomonadota bacterium]|nr:carotenoid 1,2-hydratase [Pseudomonadota bacterium]